MLRKLPPKSAALLFVIGLAIGLLVTTQLRTPPHRITNPLAPFLAVEQTRDALKQENLDLKNQVKAIRVDIEKLQDQAATKKTTIQALSSTLGDLKRMAGLTEVTKSGLVITLDDSRKGDPTIDSIIHAADLRDIVNALWYAGAEEMSINDERLVTVSSIDSIVNTILVNNTRMNPPFVIRAIGEPEKIETYLTSNPALQDLRDRSKSLGIVFNIEQSGEVTVKEFTGTFSITHARLKPD